MMLVLVALLLAFVQTSLQSTGDDGKAIELTILDVDVEVHEESRRRTQLGTGAVLSCGDPDDGDPTRVFIQSASPNSPCGLVCFELEPCGLFGSGPNANTEWCLYYLASQGSFHYAATPMYTLTIGCTDDVEATVYEVMTVTVIPNTPPVFVPSSPLSVLKTINGLATPKDTTIYQVVTNDVDQDAVYYELTTDPTSEYFQIIYTGGTIKSTNDLRLFCESSLTALVEARDSFNPDIGPLTLDLTLSPYNARPVVTNLDTTVPVDEDIGAGVVVLDLDAVDSTVYDQVYFNMKSTTSAGIEMYELDGTELKTRLNPDYERLDIQTVVLTFDVDDGFCSGSTYTLTVKVNDLPERPKFSEDNSFVEVYEGNIDTPYGLYINDNDLNEVFTYELSRANTNFGVNSATGNIYSLSEIDIDSNVLYEDFDVYMLARDSAGRQTDELHVLVRVYDSNDNPPYFNSQPFVVAATDCTDPGTVLGTVAGADDDSEYNQNNQIYFGGSGGKFAVMATGEIVLTEACIDGEGFTGTATITDQGIYPGPLSGTSATVTMACGPCPAFTVTPAPATTTGASTTVTTSNVTTAAPTTAAPVVSGVGISDYLPWVVPAIIGALVWLALTSLFCYRYYKNPCPRAFERRPRKVKVDPKPKAPPPRYKPPAPQKPPTPPPPPPPPPEPIPDPYMFGFWKETYTDQDQTKVADPTVKPRAIEHMPIGEGNAAPPEHLRLGPAGDPNAMPRFLPGRGVTPNQQPRSPSPATPPPKKRWFCRP